MSLNTRLARLEVIDGGRAPTEREMRDAHQLLLDRHHDAILLPKIFPECGALPDPNEVLLMRVAEASGRIAAAREVKRRYWKARGVDTERQQQERAAAINASIAELSRTFGSGEALAELTDVTKAGAN